MGMNTAMIIRNDFLSEIGKDADFGQKVVTAVHCGGHPNAPYHGQGFDVLSSQHADYMQVIAIGGNGIRRLGFGGAYSSTDEQILRYLADSMGYRLVKKPVRK